MRKNYVLKKMLSSESIIRGTNFQDMVQEIKDLALEVSSLYDSNIAITININKEKSLAKVSINEINL